MFARSVVVAGAVTLVAVCGFAAPALAAPVAQLKLQPVTELNVTQYLGRWYQMYGDALTQGTFELGAVCVTAEYGPRAEGGVSVLNSERVTDPVNGTPRNITGYANVPDPSQPGKLEVHLAGVPVGAEYWVFLLGPVLDTSVGYEYAVVSDALQASLFVLARDVSRFDSQYDAYVTQWLASNGWTSVLNKPIATLQAGCVYP